MEEKYLSDGVYAVFDGYQIRLRTQRENGNHFIYLEPRLFDQLVDFAKRCWTDGKHD